LARALPASRSASASCRRAPRSCTTASSRSSAFRFFSFTAAASFFSVSSRAVSTDPSNVANDVFSVARCSVCRPKSATRDINAASEATRRSSSFAACWNLPRSSSSSLITAAIFSCQVWKKTANRGEMPVR
jgi:hypothetical protein